jgi:hypothetical protein
MRAFNLSLLASIAILALCAGWAISAAGGAGPGSPI